MKLFIETNVVIDSLGNREFFYEAAGKILTLGEGEKYQLFVSAVTFINANYILGKVIKKNIVMAKLRLLREMVTIMELSDSIIASGMDSEFSDFEDAVQFYSALACKADLFITRDKKDFKKSTIPVSTPEEFLRTL